MDELEQETTEQIKCCHDPFPPELKWWQKWIVLPVSYIAGFIALVYLIDQFCQWPAGLPLSICFSYIACGFLIIVLIIDRFIRHEELVHDARLVDPSLVEAIMIEADTVEPRVKKGDLILLPINYNEKLKNLNKETTRLKQSGNRYWTEYQILSLNQMLVDFLKVDDLIASVRLSLAEVEEYAEDSAYRYDRDKFYDMKQRINEAIKEIQKEYKDYDSSNNEKEIAKEECSENLRIAKEKCSENLRAEFRTLLEHVTDYTQNWSIGSVLVRALSVVGVISIPILLIMGLLPIFHTIDGSLFIFNWGLLGISGAVTAVLLSLRKSDLVEVGNTEGRRELRNAFLGAALGLVAGVLAFSMISGGLFESGHLIPKLINPKPNDIGLSIIWAFASGFCFEKIFDRLRSSTVGEG